MLAGAVVSTVDVPPFDRAAMDGYAVIAEDTFGAGRYDAEDAALRSRRSTRVQPRRDAMSSGECIEIATGAPLPDGADAVVMVEETEKADDGAFASSRPSIRGSTSGAARPTSRRGSGSARRRRAERRAASARWPPSARSTVDVYARPRVAILSTGNEIVEPGQPLGPGQIYDINRFTLSSIVERTAGA